MSSPLYCQKSVTRQRSDYNSPLLQYANNNRNKGYFDDITIGVAKGNFSANRMVLSCYSKFFEEKFQVNQTFHKSVSIEDIDEEAVITVIDFIYSGKIIINQDNVIDLLNAAQKLEVGELRDYCFEYLESVVNFENCFYILEIANRYQNDSLKSKIFLYISKSYDATIQRPKFKELSKQNVVEFFIALNDNRFGNMALQYEAMVTWTKHNENERKTDFCDLFQLLNLDQITTNFLVNVVIKESLVQANVECSKLVMEKLGQIVNDSELKCNKSSIICLGVMNTRSRVKEVYNLSGKRPKQYPDLPIELLFSCSLKIDKSIVCVGGEIASSENATNQVWQMDLMKDELQWKEIASMKLNRFIMGAAIYQDSIVVVGGLDGKSSLRSTETFNMESNQWKVIASLNQARAALAIVENGGCLFAIGGCDDDNTFSSVERLRGLDDKWENIQPMKYPRMLFAAVACQSKIFAIGGLSTESENSAMKSVEMFDHSKQKWSEIKSMNIERWGHSACVLRDKIFVVGGKNKEGEYMKEIGCYDVTNDQWSIVSFLDDRWYGQSTVAL